MTFQHLIPIAAAALFAGASDNPVPLYNNLGNHHKAISTRVPAAQRYFDQGLRLVYGFNHAEAIRARGRMVRITASAATSSTIAAPIAGR